MRKKKKRKRKKEKEKGREEKRRAWNGVEWKIWGALGVANNNGSVF